MSVTTRSVAPSAVSFNVPGLNIPVTLTPRALSDAEIMDVVDRFVFAARILVEAGFDGS